MKTKIAFFCVPVLMLMASSAMAQSCGSGRVIVSNPVYHAPVVVQKQVVAHEVITPIAIPVALPVIVPAFTYQYAPPYCGVPAVGFGGHGVGHPGYAPPVAPPVGQPGYGQGYQMPGYGAQPAGTQYNGPYQQPPVAPQPVLPGAGGNDKLRELAKLLLEEMRRQDSADQGGTPGDDGPPMAVYPGSPAPVSNPPATGGTPGAFPPATGTPPAPAGNVGAGGGRPNPQSPFAQPAINALARNCMECHTGPGSKGDAVIFNQRNILNPEAPFRTMLKEMESGRMPPRQSSYRFTQDEFQAVQAWLQGR